MIHDKRGFSLIEVLIFVSVLSVFFISAISISTVTVRNMQINEHKIIATKHAEELVEWLRSEKENDWGGAEWTSSSGAPLSFTERVTRSGSVTTYCFNSTTIDWSSRGACSPAYGFPYKNVSNFFKREATLSGTAVVGYINQVTVDIVVEWQELGNTYQVPIKTVFSIYEE